MRGTPMHGGVPAWPAPRPWTPLALALGLHLLLVLAWVGGARREFAREPAPRTSTVVYVQAPSLPRSRASTAAQPPSLPRPLQPRRPAPPSIALPATPVATPSPLPPPGQARTPDSTLTSSEPPSGAEPQAGAPSATQPGELLATAKAMAGRVDRELRKGSPPVMAEPERKWERFAEAFAAARTGGDRIVRLDTYTGPDGVTVYRKTVGGRTACYRSGSVGGLVTGFGAADGAGAGTTTCPSNVRWTRQ